MKINNAILHVFDFVSCINVFSEEELDCGVRTQKSYVTRIVRKALTSLDNMHGEFSAESTFADGLRAYARGERGFADLSRQIGEYLADQLGRMSKSVSTDLLVVDFEEEPDLAPGQMTDEQIERSFSGAGDRYVGLFLLESKQAYMHEVGKGESGGRNDIVRHFAILPNPSQKLTSFALIDLRTLEVTFQDKKREIAGEETWLIPDGLLRCSMQASTKDTLGAVTRIVEEVAEEYGANTAVALSKAKAYAAQSVEENDDIELEALADEVFVAAPAARDRFEQVAREQQMPERMPLEREAVRRVTRNHKIVTDTGIVITFPAEYARTSDYITFTSEPDGKISIQLKNISHIENR